MEKKQDCWRNAILIQADFHEFRPGENYHYPQVQSCYLSYFLTGRGTVRINNKDFSCTAGTLLFAPWNHTITYLPDQGEPFSSVSVHIIPDCEEHGEIIFNAFHSIQSDHPLYLKRHNEAMKNFNIAASFRCCEESRIVHLLNYAYDSYISGSGEDQLRLLGRMFFYEIYDLLNGNYSADDKYPVQFQKVLNVIADNLEHPMNMKNLAKSCNISIAGIARMFRKYLNTSPQKYFVRRRMHHAAQVLRQSSVSITSLGRSLQFSTEGNFCRAFKKEFGVSPREYRRNPFELPDTFRSCRRSRNRDKDMKTKFIPQFIPENKTTP